MFNTVADTEELHGIFAVTIYGDRIRVSHYGTWDEVIIRWDALDQYQRSGMNPWKLIKFFCVRSWTDPDWNLSRYRSLDTIGEAETS